jgi:hypothetical protein
LKAPAAAPSDPSSDCSAGCTRAGAMEETATNVVCGSTKTFGFNRPHLFVPTLSWQKINFFYHESKWRQKRCFPRTALEPGAIVTADDSALNDELSLPMVMLHCSGDAAPSPCTASVAGSTSAGAVGIAAWCTCLDEDEDEDDAKRILPELNVAGSKHGPAEDTFSPQRSLCLSRACLGKLIVFSIKVPPKKGVFRTGKVPYRQRKVNTSWRCRR